MKTATAGNGDWRAVFVPFADNGQLQQIRIYSRRHKGSAREGGAPIRVDGEA